jgi:hypothetical protein
MTVLSMTRLQLKSIGLLPEFLIWNERLVKQLRVANGFIKGKTLGDERLGMWTAVLWNNEADMRAYFTSGTHGGLMPKLDYFSCASVTAHIPYDLAALPPWDFVHEKLSSIGRFSAVLRAPTDDHRNRIIAKPKMRLLTRPLKPKKTLTN